MTVKNVLSANFPTQSEYLLLEVQTFSANPDGSDMVSGMFEERYCCWAEMSARDVVRMYLEDVKRDSFEDGLSNVHFRTDADVATGRLTATDPVDNVEYVIHVRLFLDN